MIMEHHLQAYELMKYERILNLPASHVNYFLAKEAIKPTKVEENEDHIHLERLEEERRNKAAKFRKYHQKRLAAKYLRDITIIKPRRRLELIEITPDTEINSSIVKRLGPSTPLNTFKALLKHKETMESIEDNLPII
uniref:Uncharacterized protein n=1 Tax=Heterorhabditis bacteriophora TaxID=37862 RepID=A0A1I7X6N3_HETBA